MEKFSEGLSWPTCSWPQEPSTSPGLSHTQAANSGLNANTDLPKQRASLTNVQERRHHMTKRKGFWKITILIFTETKIVELSFAEMWNGL